MRGKGGLRGSLLLLSLNFAACSGPAVAVAALGLDFATVQASALARSGASELDMKSCAYLGFGGCSDFRNCLTVSDRDFFRRSEWMLALLLLHLIAAVVAHSDCRNFLTASGRGSFHCSVSMTILLLLLLRSIAVAVVDSDSAPSSSISGVYSADQSRAVAPFPKPRSDHCRC